jgi:hypothetical protein
MLLLLLNTTYFIIYIYTVKQSLCINISNSQNMLGNIFANEQFHRKLMFSGDIELNPGSVTLFKTTVQLSCRQM